MTNDKRQKAFDSVATMRRIRDRISSQIAGKTHEEIIQWLRGYHYTDPVLQRLAIRSCSSESLDAAMIEERSVRGT